MPASKNPVLAAELGSRIDQAWQSAGFASRKDMCAASDLRDYSQLSQWATGKAVPRLESLMEIARVCEVSLDWLAFGRSQSPTTFLDWLEGPGANVSERGRAFLRSLPLTGAWVTVRFYSVAHRAFEGGATPEEAVRAAHQDARLDH